MMKKYAMFLACLAAMTCLLTSCGTRSISDSGYRNRYGYGYSDSQYQGELNELSVLGISGTDPISEADIQASLTQPKQVSLRRGDSVLLIQSGAMFPDDPMMRGMQTYFTIIPLSGIPERPAASQTQTAPVSSQENAASLHKTLRLAAARSGAKSVIVYWGILETAQENQVTKTISWVPILGSIIPDEAQQMRIRLKAAIIDAASGDWTMLAPDAFSDTAFSARLDRKAADQMQVSLLKEKAYQALVEELVQTFSLQK